MGSVDARAMQKVHQTSPNFTKIGEEEGER